MSNIAVPLLRDPVSRGPFKQAWSRTSGRRVRLQRQPPNPGLRFREPRTLLCRASPDDFLQAKIVTEIIKASQGFVRIPRSPRVRSVFSCWCGGLGGGPGTPWVPEPLNFKAEPRSSTRNLRITHPQAKTLKPLKPLSPSPHAQVSNLPKKMEKFELARGHGGFRVEGIWDSGGFRGFLQGFWRFWGMMGLFRFCVVCGLGLGSWGGGPIGFEATC